MRYILIAITLLSVGKMDAQVIKTIPGADVAPMAQFSSYSRWTEGSFIKLRDTTYYIYTGFNPRTIYVSMIENDQVIILDSLGYNTINVSQEPSRQASTNHYPNAVASGDTIYINTSTSVYKWRWGFINTEYPTTTIHDLSVDQNGVVYACERQEVLEYTNGHWDTAYVPSLSWQRKLEHLGDTFVLNNVVGAECFLGGSSVENITGARHIKNVNGHLYYLHHSLGYVYKRLAHNNYVPFDRSEQNKFYDCLDFAYYDDMLWMTGKKNSGDEGFKLYFLREGIWYQASDLEISFLEVIDSTLYLHGENPYRLTKYSYVEGVNYFDIDKNCSEDSTDHRVVDFIYFNEDKVRNSSGAFSLLISPNTEYVITAAKPLYSKGFLCSTDTFYISNVPEDTVFAHDFIQDLDTTILDVELGCGLGLARRGFRVKGAIQLQNHNVQKYSSLELHLYNPDGLSDFDCNHPFTASGDSLIFTIASLEDFGKYHIPFSFRIDTLNFQLGDTFCLYARLFVADSVSGNNADTICKMVIGAYDPNMKTSYPSGAITKPVDKIDYTIQFQNMGSYMATNVRVIDTIDTRLPIEYIRVKATSHPHSYSLQVRNNVLIWTFNGINLPDSGSDPAGSEGFISYEAKVKSAFLKQGDQVDNRAFIYFDYEAPVETNMASVFLRDENSSIPPPDSLDKALVMCYPNPSKGIFKLKNSSDLATPVWIYDAKGQLVLDTLLNARETKEIMLDDQAPGLYFLRTEIGNAIRLSVF